MLDETKAKLKAQRDDIPQLNQMEIGLHVWMSYGGNLKPICR